MQLPSRSRTERSGESVEMNLSGDSTTDPVVDETAVEEGRSLARHDRVYFMRAKAASSSSRSLAFFALSLDCLTRLASRSFLVGRSFS